MCKNNFTNENEFDFSLWDDIHILPAPRPDDIPYDYWVLPDEVCNPCGSFNFVNYWFDFDFWGLVPPFDIYPDSVCNPSGPLGGVINTYGPTIIINN